MLPITAAPLCFPIPAHCPPTRLPRRSPRRHTGGPNGVVLDGCISNPPTLACNSSPAFQTPEELKIELAALPQGSDEYLLKLGELMTALLTEKDGSYGLDSAIALLERAQQPGFDEKLLQLQARKADDGSADYESRQARPRQLTGAGALTVARTGPAGSVGDAPPTPPTLAARSGGSINYFRRVLELLQPYNSDSARQVAVLTDAALRTELTQMAEDSTAWGSMTARAALNQYAGTNYRPLTLADDDDAAGAARSVQATPTPARAAEARLVLSPNPSSGAVRVGYGLPQAAREVTLRVYDDWGRPAGEYALTAAALEAGVSLHLRAGLYHCRLVADGKVVATERLLISH